MKNISNSFSTNKFESFTGAINIVPVKLSGNYKLFVSLDGNLFLDDYVGRRVKIDKNQSFLPQVANFLKTNTTIDNYLKLRYGAYRNNLQLSYQAPLYINGNTPKYFTICKTLNSRVTTSDLHDSSDILKIYDLDKIGVTSIFKEINDTFDYMLHYDFDDSKLLMFGYSISEESKVQSYFLTSDLQANQTKIENLNNTILNNYVKNNMIFPKFITIDFEFNYTNQNNTNKFDNFFGMYSFDNQIVSNEYDNTKLTIDIKDYFTKIEYNQIFDLTLNNWLPTEFYDIVGVSKIYKSNISEPQVRIDVKNIAPGDYFRIIHPDTSTFFEYTVLSTDIKSTFFATLVYLANRITILSNKNIRVVIDGKRPTQLKFILNFDESTLSELYELQSTNNVVFVDNTHNFRSIQSTDIIVTNYLNVDDFTAILYNNATHIILDRFLFDGKQILRIADTFVFNTEIDTITIFTTRQSSLKVLKPIDYLVFDADFECVAQYEKNKYISNLRKLFDVDTNNIDNREVFNQSVLSFESTNQFIDKFQYIKIDSDEFNVSNKPLINRYNLINVLNSYFCSPGNTAMLTPNILNFDLRFYEKSLNIDYNKFETDDLRFHWFLINGITPEYIKPHDVRSLRYFTDKPKLTSRLIATFDNLNYCETIFLGVKYRLPIKYKNYNFAVYLNYQDLNYLKTTYTFDVNNIDKTLYLKINQYLDFVDLIKGGDNTYTPVLDLSLLYTTKASYNTLSNNLSSFQSGGLLLCDTTIPVTYGNTVLNDWRYYDSTINGGTHLICIKRNLQTLTEPLDEVITPDEDNNYEFFIYSSVEINNVKTDYKAISFKLKNIIYIKPDFLWCEDLEVKFFDTPLPTTDLILNYYDVTTFEELLITQASNITELSVSVNLQLRTISIGDARTFIIINNYDNGQPVFTLKKNYFELSRTIVYDEISSVPEVSDAFFYFPEYINAGWNFNDLVTEYGFESFDTSTPFSKISLFNRNQLWLLVREIIGINTVFKISSEKQVRRLINKLLVNNLVEYSNLTDIAIDDTTEFIDLEIIPNDYNVVIWQFPTKEGKTVPKISKISRYNSVYLPYLCLVSNELEFQNQILSNENLINIYEPNYIGPNISATGFYNEVSGNIVSSLFTYYEDLTYTIVHTTEILNLVDILINVISIDDAIFINKNETTISKITKNIDSYIHTEYIKWLLFNVYYLDSVYNEFNKKIGFKVIDNNQIKLDLKENYLTSFNNATFTFKRRK